jgi:DNA-binding Xre family transcriptional regulator
MVGKIDIRDNLKKLIDDKGVKLVHLSEKTGITPTKLSLTLNKKRSLSADELFALCDILDVTLNEVRYYHQNKRAG